MITPQTQEGSGTHVHGPGHQLNASIFESLSEPRKTTTTTTRPKRNWAICSPRCQGIPRARRGRSIPVFPARFAPNAESGTGARRGRLEPRTPPAKRTDGEGGKLARVWDNKRDLLYQYTRNSNYPNKSSKESLCRRTSNMQYTSPRHFIEGRTSTTILLSGISIEGGHKALVSSQGSNNKEITVRGDYIRYHICRGTMNGALTSGRMDLASKHAVTPVVDGNRPRWNMKHDVPG